MDGDTILAGFRSVLEDIKRGDFARRFQDEANSGYPVLAIARDMIHGSSPIADAEQRLRHLVAPQEPGSEPEFGS